MSPVAHSDGGDRFELGDELSPSEACRPDNRLFRRPSQVLAQRLQLFSARLSSEAGREEDGSDAAMRVELARLAPSDPVKQQHGVGILTGAA